MTLHKLRTWPTYFQATKLGKKLFEFRENDRNYKSGDVLLLLEYDPDTDTYSGDMLTVTVTSLLTHEEFPALPETHVVMGIEHPGQTILRDILLEHFYDEEQDGFPNYDAPGKVFDTGCWGGDMMVDFEEAGDLDEVLTFLGHPPFEVTPKGDCEECLTLSAHFCTLEALDAPCVTCKKPKMTRFQPIVEIPKKEKQALRKAILEGVDEHGEVELIYLSDLIEEREPRFNRDTIRHQINMMIDSKDLQLTYSGASVRLP